jgi:hemoglobin
MLSPMDEMSPWDQLGGDAVLLPLLKDFYARIARSPIAKLFPPDLTETQAKQFAFQSDFWGGPVRYAPWRGHPRLRARHLPFAIGRAEAKAWMACMTEAVEHSAMPTEFRAAFLQRMRMTAEAMINRDDAAGHPF